MFASVDGPAARWAFLRAGASAEQERDAPPPEGLDTVRVTAAVLGDLGLVAAWMAALLRLGHLALGLG